MMLIGMLDSPFVRSVALALNYYGLPFEHANWSVGADFDRIRRYNPLGRVPTLVLDDGACLVESQAIHDELDERAGGSRPLLPSRGPERREALQLIALAIGACEKGRDQLYERVFRPSEKWHAPWIDRCRAQMQGALEVLDRRIAVRRGASWLIGDHMTRADVMVTCIATLLSESVEPGLRQGRYPALESYVESREALPEFRATYVAWTSP